MEYGLISVIPPIIAIACAMITKDVLLSLFIGVSFGVMALASWNPMAALMQMFSLIGTVLSNADNVGVILIVVLLGALIGLLQKSGGSAAFAEWMGTRIKNRAAAQMVCWLMGLIIFFDDFFNALAIGAIMRPVTDKLKISREKLSYILDSTAGPVCIIAPVSSWVAFVSSLIAGGLTAEALTDKPFSIFIQTIPYNFYAWAAILIVPVIILTKKEYGPMVKAEKRSYTTGKTFDDSKGGSSIDDFKDMVCSEKGKVMDMILPIAVMFITSFYFMLYTGGYFDGGMSIAEAFFDTDAVGALTYGIFLAALTAVILYKIRRTVSIAESVEAMVMGMRSMFFALCFMTLAWGIGEICGQLDTAGYLVSLLGDNISGAYIPVLVYLIAALTAFCTGSSWGTYAIMVPITISLAVAVDANLALSIAAVLGGGVFGDHCSPLADTTILSAAGAGVDLMDHFKTQLPYGLTAFASATVGFFLAGFMENPLIPLAATIAIFIALVFILNKVLCSKEDAKALVDEAAI